MAQGRPDYYKSNIIMGKYNSAFLPVLLDESGTILARLQSLSGEKLKDLLIDSSGVLYTRLQGTHPDGQQDILVNRHGNLLTEIQGKDGDELKSLYVNNEGKLVTKNQAVGGGINPLYFIEDGGDTDTIEDWVEEEMALNPVDAGAFGAEGVKSMKLGINGALPGYPSAWWKKSTDLGNLSIYQYKHIYLRFWIETLDFFSPESWSVTYEIGTDSANLIGFEWPKSELAEGWNILKMNIQQPAYSDGTINWSNIQFQNFSLKIDDINEDIFYVIIDYIAFVELNPNKDMLMNIKTDENGTLLSKISGNYAGFAKPIEADISGNLKTNLSAQDLLSVTANKYSNSLKEEYQPVMHYTIELREMCDLVGPGVIMGGDLFHEGAVSHKGCSVIITIDGVTFNDRNFQELNQRNSKVEWSTIPHLLCYNNTTFRYTLGFPNGLLFNTQFKVQLNEIVDATSSTIMHIYYSLL